MTTTSTPREISYAWSAETWYEQWVIRAIENMTGRLRLIRMAVGYEDEIAEGSDVWAVMQKRYRLHLDIPALDNLPSEGPAVCIANHPFGICDGLALGRLLSMRRHKKDFKIIAHTVFRKAQELNDHILPISFDDTREAVALNLQTRKEALDFVKQGGCVAIFPGGCVSTPAKPLGQPIDPRWKTFTAKLAARSDAAVVPIFFEGENSRLFQIASHLSQTLRYALLINEFKYRVGTSVRIHVGEPIDRAEIDARKGDALELMDYLRDSVYALSPEPFENLGYGWSGE